MKAQITITFDTDALQGYTDQHLASLWHVAQANPVDGFSSDEPGQLAEKIGREIIRRFLASTRPSCGPTRAATSHPASSWTCARRKLPNNKLTGARMGVRVERPVRPGGRCPGPDQHTKPTRKGGRFETEQVDRLADTN